MTQFSHQRLPSHIRRRRIALLAIAVAIVAVVVAIATGGGGGTRPERLVPGGGGAGVYDPLAYDAAGENDLVQRAAAGFSDVVWEKSPGGVVATARRTARWRPLIEKAAKANGVSADTIEAIVFLESAGRADAVAAGDVEGAAGLTQILPSTATALLRMHVDVAKSKKLAAEIAGAGGKKLRKLERERQRVDQRFDPQQAVGGCAIYLAQAQKDFGREDLAIASYHMGIGNLQNVLARYHAQGGDEHPSYAKLYFDSAPLWHGRAYSLLSSFGDDSSTYLWRVDAARSIMRLWRTDPRQLQHLMSLENQAGGAARRLFPEGAPAQSGGGGRPPAYPGLRFSGSAAGDFAPSDAARAALVYIGIGAREISGVGPLRVTSARGVRIEISRHYRNQAQALAFQYLLDRLQAWNLIAWGRNGSTLAIVVGPEAAKVLPPPAQMIRDARRPRGG